MYTLKIDKELSKRVPNIELSCIDCEVVYADKNEELWLEIQNTIEKISCSLKTEDISKLPAITASRKAYKVCGKDPARYRLSAEALLRRVVKRKELYQVNNIVDLLNLVSISTGFSIGGYDVNKIEGDVVFGIGTKNEPYEGIGRGELNIEGMPVFRDEKSAFGTPTSDSVRTCVTKTTVRFLMVIIDYNSSEELEIATKMAKDLLVKYANAENFKINSIKN